MKRVQKWVTEGGIRGAPSVVQHHFHHAARVVGELTIKSIVGEGPLLTTRRRGRGDSNSDGLTGRRAGRGLTG